MPEYAYITSMESPKGTPWVMGVNASESNQAQIMERESSAGAQNQLWLITPGVLTSAGGYIVSAVNPATQQNPTSQVLALGPLQTVDGHTNVQTVCIADQTNDGTQLWTMAAAGMSGDVPVGSIVNVHNGQTLAVSSGRLAANNPLSMWTPAPLSQYPYTTWTVDPLGVPFGQSTAIVTALAPAWEGTAMAMTIQGGSFEPGAAVVLDALNTNAGVTDGQYASNSTAMWQYTANGFIESMLVPGLFLSLGPAPVGDAPQTVVVYPQAVGNLAFQRWNIVTVPAENQDTGEDEQTTITVHYATHRFVNVSNSQYLTVSGGATAAGTPIVTAPSTNQDDQNWVDSCGYPLEGILMQPPVPYAAYTGADLTAYQYAGENLANPAPTYPDDLRGQYSGLTPTQASSWIQQLAQTHPTVVNEMLPPPASDVDPSAWSAVSSQLIAELQCVSGVQNLYLTWVNPFLTNQALMDDLSVSVVANAFSVSDTATAQSKCAGTIEGMIEAGINLIPDVGGCLATLMQTALNGCVSSGQVPTNAEPVVVSALQGELLNTLQTVASNVALQTTAIVNDWAKVQAVSALCTYKPAYPNSLYWDDDDNTTFLDPTVQGFQLSVIQAILAGEYQLFVWLNVANHMDMGDMWRSPAFNADTDVWWQESLAMPVYNLYVMANATIVSPGGQNVAQIDQISNPPQSAMQDYLWSRGVLKFNVFRGLGGWSGLTRSILGAGTATGQASQWIQLFNATPWTLDIEVQPSTDNMLSWDDTGGPQTQWNIGPYEECAFANWWDGRGTFSDSTCSANVMVCDSASHLILLEFQALGNQASKGYSPPPAITNVLLYPNGLTCTGGGEVQTFTPWGPQQLWTNLVEL